MASVCNTAVVLCPESAEGGRQQLLGLTVGERVLLALSFSGIKTIAFVGSGSRPSCDRADINVVDAATLNLAETHLIVSCDVVFDRSLLAEKELPDDIPLAYRSGDALSEWLSAPDDAYAQLGTGSASSGQGFAIRVDGRSAVKRAERALLLSLRKPMDGIVSKYLNRHVSLFCTRYLIKTGLAPNFFTVVFMAIGVAGAYFATQAEYAWALVLAGLLFQGQSILDGCDGEMARLTYQFSRRGQWLDSIGDDLTNYSVCFGLAVGQARVLDQPWLYWLGGAVLAMQVLTSAVLYRRMLIMGTGDLLAIPDLVRTPNDNDGIIASLFDLIGTLLKRDSFIFILSVVIILQLPLWAFYLYGAGTVPMTLGVLLNEYRISQQVASEQVA